MSERADDIRIESDEDGFHLIVEVTDDEGVERLDFLIPYPETFYKRVRYEIEPWLREKKAAQRTSREARQCGHTATGHGFGYICDLPSGHQGLHRQRLELRDGVSITNWGDDGLAPHATKYPEAGSLRQRAFASVDNLKGAIREGIEASGDDTGYELDDPKHPTFHDRHADIWDARDKVMDAVDDMEREAFGSAIVGDAMNESTKEEA